MIRSTTRQVTLAAVFAAVYLGLRVIPTFQMVGISWRFAAADLALTSIAVLAGVWSGAVCVVVGTILAYGVKPPIFFGLDFLPGLANILIAGLVLSKRFRTARTIYIAIIVAYVLSPYSLLFGYAYVPFTWLHIIALALLLSPFAEKVPIWMTRHDSHQIGAIALLAFFGTMTQHLAGGLLYEVTVGVAGGSRPSIVREFWQIIFWLYPTERIVIVVMSTIMATALTRSLRKWSSEGFRQA